MNKVRKTEAFGRWLEGLLKIDYGPGYRVYYTRTGKSDVLMLRGGEKRTQQADIAMARSAAKEVRR